MELSLRQGWLGRLVEASAEQLLPGAEQTESPAASRCGAEELMEILRESEALLALS